MPGPNKTKGTTTWTWAEIQRLRKLCASGISWRQIAHIIGRPASGCFKTAQAEGINKPKCKPRAAWKDAA